MRPRAAGVFPMVLALVALCPGPPAGAAETAPPADPLASRLQQKLDRLTSLKGDFVQTLESSSLGRTRTEQGRFWIRKPGLMRWEYRSPEEKLAVVDGAHAWLYLPEEREAQRGPAAGIQRSGAAALLTGRLRLDRDFRSRRPDAGETAGELPLPPRTVLLELTPLRDDLEFQKVLIAVEPDRLEILRLVLIDPLGDRMVFTFSGLQEDASLPDGLFRFEPPPGVRVIETGDGPR